MKKLKITQEQLGLLESNKRRLIKITEEQLKSISEYQKNQPTTVKANSLFESKNQTKITSKIVELLEDIFNNPDMIGEDVKPMLKEAGITQEELMAVLNDKAIKEFVETKYTDGSKILGELNDTIGGKIDEMSLGGANGINTNGNDITYDANIFGKGPLNPNDDDDMPIVKNGTEVKVVNPGETMKETTTNPSGVLKKKKDGSYQKISKTDGNYRKSDNTQRKCSICENYTKGKCKNVKGDIKPNMVCDGFEKKKVKETKVMSKGDMIIESIAKQSGKTFAEVKNIINSKK